jgi:hypothetical protein
VLIWRSQEIELLERPRNRWEDDIKIDLKEIGWEDVEWTRLTQDSYQCWAVENTVLKNRISLNEGHFSTM